MDSKFILNLASVATYDSVQYMEIVRKITNCLQNFKSLIPASLFYFILFVYLFTIHISALYMFKDASAFSISIIFNWILFYFIILFYFELL